ncbi:YidC/Oxa1 family membrane protein insertase [Calidithermus chliarophilus]|uniref:YidC/Oxa1 family membrane protein insertase n=1 Tax=Calidithermus chliarophilus TaxID=52023 RepID=UPI0003FB7871|nr:YidC/Oxa1 family membrane protein insertase [Calidithermus chliarophilus]
MNHSSRPRLAKLALGLTLGLLFTLSPALALKAEWRDADVNGDSKNEKVAVTNLADVALNTQGQIVGWYPKQVRGTDFKGNYNGKLNLVRPGVPLPGTLSGFTSPQAEFTQAPNGNKGGKLTATFTQGDAKLTYVIDPLFLSLEVSVESDSPRVLSWSGIGGTDRPLTKWLTPGNTQPTESGSGKPVYVAWQHSPTKGYAMVVQPVQGFDQAKLARSPSGDSATLEISAPAGQATTFRAYGGFNEMVRLHVERYLELPGLFNPDIWGRLSLALLWVMEQGHRWTGSWFFGIVLLTLIVRLLLWPLMHQQYKSMAEMNKIQPLIQEINKKFKDNPEKRTEATMKLYQEHKINPFAGCLPLFLQLPVLFVLWKVIANYEFGQGVLWIPDLALPDPFYILPILYILTTLASTYLSAAGNPDALRQGMIMNLVFVFFIFSFPSGVSIYWILSMVITLAQQWLIKRSLGDLKPATANAKSK